MTDSLAIWLPNLYSKCIWGGVEMGKDKAHHKCPICVAIHTEESSSCFRNAWCRFERHKNLNLPPGSLMDLSVWWIPPINFCLIIWHWVHHIWSFLKNQAINNQSLSILLWICYYSGCSLEHSSYYLPCRSMENSLANLICYVNQESDSWCCLYH